MNTTACTVATFEVYITAWHDRKTKEKDEESKNLLNDGINVERHRARKEVPFFCVPWKNNRNRSSATQTKLSGTPLAQL